MGTHDRQADGAFLSMRIIGVKRPCVAAWTDSSLFGFDSPELRDSEAILPADRHRMRSQGGCLVAVLDADRLGETSAIPLSVLDWRSRVSNRESASLYVRG